MNDYVFLFDIDGTLLKVNEGFMRPLIRDILDDLQIHYPNMEQDSFGGRTDYDIFNSFISGRSDQTVMFQELKHRYIAKMETEISGNHVHIIDSAISCVKELNKHGAHIGLVTGNFQESGIRKLKVSGIDHYFKFGGFGDDHADRNMLPPLAYSNFTRYSSVHKNPEDFVIIGDTPKDIICAKRNGAKSVAVTTGNFSESELAKFEPDLILDSLGNPEQWISQLS